MDLALDEGESVALVGESGCGKSTLLRSIAGLRTRSTTVSIEFGKGARPQMVFQDAGASLTPWLTVGELIGERLRSEGIGRQGRASGWPTPSPWSACPPRWPSAKPAQLSGGQRQRVALARATVVPPEVLLCDEPTSALDVSLAATVLNLIGRLRREFGMAMLFVTHDLAAARMVADRIAVMYLGRIVEIGAADELCADPVAPLHPGAARHRARGGPGARAAAGRAGQPARPAGRLPVPPPLPCRGRLVRHHARSPLAGGAGFCRTAGGLPGGTRGTEGDRWRSLRPSSPPPPAPGHGPAWAGPDGCSAKPSVADLVGFILLVVLVLAGIFAPLIAPYSPITPSGLPFTATAHGGHLMGTDEVGFDIFSRVLFGLRTSLVGVVLVVTSGVVIGGTIGLVAGAAGGWVDTVLMRITDLFLALPGPVLAIAVVAALGPSYCHTLLAVAIVWWPFYARIMRGEIRSLAARPHLEAAALAGAGPFRRAFRHLLPGAIAGHRGHGQPRRRQPGPHPGRAVLPRPRGPGPGPRARGHGRPGPAVPAPGVVGPGHAGRSRSSSSPWRPTSRATGSTTPMGGRDDPVRCVKRLVAMVLILLVLTFIVFLLQRLSEINPAHAYLGANACQAAVAKETHILGYDKPLLGQYLPT